MTHIGPQMRLVLAYVSQHPGCTKFALALHVAPHGSATVHFGYRVVNRCIQHGLILATRLSNRYSLGVVDGALWLSGPT